MENSTQINPAIATIGLPNNENYTWYSEGALVDYFINCDEIETQLFGSPPNYDNTPEALVRVEEAIIFHAVSNYWEFNLVSMKNIAKMILIYVSYEEN